MQDYIPRLVLLDSETIASNHFICGFISIPTEASITVGDATYYPSDNGDLPNLVFPELKSFPVERPIQLLPPFTFNNEIQMPEAVDVEFQNGSNQKPPKIKVIATMGHPNDDFPMVYVPRVFVLNDGVKGGQGSGSVVYGLLMDIYEGDIIRYEAVGWDDVVVSINTENQVSQKVSTAILLFPLNAVLPSFLLNLEGQGRGVKTIPYKGSPVYNTLND